MNGLLSGLAKMYKVNATIKLISGKTENRDHDILKYSVNMSLNIGKKEIDILFPFHFYVKQDFQVN